jgi:hypothetical protein
MARMESNLHLLNNLHLCPSLALAPLKCILMIVLLGTLHILLLYVLPADQKRMMVHDM